MHFSLFRAHDDRVTILTLSEYCIMVWDPPFFTDKISNVNTLLLFCMYQYHVVYINVMFVYINVMLYTSMLCL